MTVATCQIQTRHKVVVNTDPQRRCYDGCYYSSEIQWSDWDTIAWGIPEANVDFVLEWWCDLNKYAISERGPMAERKYRAVKN